MRSEFGGKRERESSVIGMEEIKFGRELKVWDMEKEAETLGKEMMQDENK